jgi:transcriptional regulator with XRE-family HTH domain
MKFYREKFKEIRKSQRWSSEALSKAANISRQSISKWENGKSVPSEKKVRQLAEVLGINESEISDIPASYPISGAKISETIATNILLNSINTKTANKDIKNILSSLKHIDKSMSESSIILKAVLIYTNNIIYIKDPDQKYVIANKSFFNALSLNFGYNVKGRLDTDFYSKHEARENTQEDEEVLRRGYPIIGKEKHIPGTRKQKWGIFSKIPILDEENRIIGLLGVIVDITERRKEEKHSKILEYAISKLKETVWVGKGINNAQDTPALFKELVYTSVPYSENQYVKAFWGDINPNDLTPWEVLKIWRSGMSEKTKENFIKFKKNITFPATRQYSLLSPITKKEIWISESIEFDKQNECFIGSISYNPDVVKLNLFNEIINETPNIIVWIGNRCYDEKSFMYQYLSETENITGYKTSYFTDGNIIIDLVIDPESKSAIIEKFVEDKFPFTFEYKIKTKNGKERLLRSFYYKIGDESIFAATYYGFHLDITSTTKN